jgi:hypothetical protein
MDELLKKICKMAKDYADMQSISEKVIADNMDNVRKGCTPEQVAFIESSISKAKEGSLDVNQFISKFKDFKNGC